MSPSNHPALRLRIIDEHDRLVDDCNIAIFDSGKTCVFQLSSLDQPTHEIVALLKFGLYDIQVSRGATTTRKLIRHAQERRIDMVVPAMRSAMPSPGAAGTHEYYSEPARYFSSNSSRDADSLFPGVDGSSRLMVFVRRYDRDTRDDRPLLGGMSLCDSIGNEITHFAPEVIEQDDDFGWAAFSAALPPGQFLLRHHSNLFPLSVIAGWGTYVFLPHVDGVDMAAGTIHLNQTYASFDPSSEVSEATNRAIALARAHDTAVPYSLRRQLWGMKFENPIAGMLAVYATIDAKRPDLPVLDEATYNLENLLPDSPDVAALRVAVAMARDEAPNPDTIKGIPMLGRSTATLYHAIRTFDHDVKWDCGQLFDFRNIMVGSLWTIWDDQASLDVDIVPSDLERQPSGEGLAAVLRSTRDDRIPHIGAGPVSLNFLQQAFSVAVENYWRSGDMQSLEGLVAQLRSTTPPDDSEDGSTA